MKAILLSAGASSRLHPATLHRHKSMLQVGRRTLVDLQLDVLAAGGITEFVIVVGHGRGELVAHVNQLHSEKIIRFIENSNFSTLNIDHSLFLGINQLDEAFLYFEGDMLVSPSIISALVNSDAEVCLAVDSFPKSGKVDTLVLGSGGRPAKLYFSEHGSLQLAEHPTAMGELLCVMKFGRTAACRLNSCLVADNSIGPMRLYSYIDDLLSTSSSNSILATGTPWIEIDTPQDLERSQIIAHEIELLLGE